jgi:hypothetical protein
MLTTEVLCQKLGYKLLTSASQVPINAGYTSDLLSDVIANCPENGVWITVQRHLNVIAVAQLKGVAAIVFPNGVMPDAPLVERAQSEGISLASSPDNPFVTTGKIYALILSAT